jgi:hypothetical protein
MHGFPTVISRLDDVLAVHPAGPYLKFRSQFNVGWRAGPFFDDFVFGVRQVLPSAYARGRLIEKVEARLPWIQ